LPGVSQDLIFFQAFMHFWQDDIEPVTLEHRLEALDYGKHVRCGNEDSGHGYIDE
jgi:hypothetical protein